MYSEYPTSRLSEPGDKFFIRRLAAWLVLSTAVLIAGGCRYQAGEDTLRQAESQTATLATPGPTTDESRSVLRCSIQSGNGRTRPVAAPLRVGEEFRLVFEGSAGCYLYVIAPSGLDQRPTVMLNGSATDSAGLRLNYISAGERYTFPSRKDAWLVLGRRSRVTIVTILLSNAPLDDIDGLGTKPPSGLSDRQWCEIERRSRLARNGIDVVEQPDGSCIVTCNGASCGEGVVSFELALEVVLPTASAHFDSGYADALDGGLRITTTGERS